MNKTARVKFIFLNLKDNKVLEDRDGNENLMFKKYSSILRQRNLMTTQ